jgi:PIN domain nuclease of toxin-antitoxin system
LTSLLVDTHALLWWRSDEGRLGSSALQAMEDVATPLYLSAASIWELEIKRAKGKLEAPEDLLETTRQRGFAELAVLSPHAIIAARLPPYHGDPFDRMLIAQAQRENLTIVTNDRRIAAYDVPVLW